MGGSCLLVRFYRIYRAEADAERFARRVSRHYTVATLERLLSNGRRPARRAAVVALGLLGNIESNSILARGLCDSDRRVRRLSESALRHVWTRAAPPPQQRQLDRVMRLNLAQHFREALTRCTELLEEAPCFAEAWNQRSVAQYHLGRYREAIQDSQQTLQLNPFHFSAAASMGQCYLQLGQGRHALDCFRRALKLNPNMKQVRAGVRYLEKLFDDGS